MGFGSFHQVSHICQLHWQPTQSQVRSLRVDSSINKLADPCSCTRKVGMLVCTAGTADSISMPCCHLAFHPASTACDGGKRSQQQASNTMSCSKANLGAIGISVLSACMRAPRAAACALLSWPAALLLRLAAQSRLGLHARWCVQDSVSVRCV